MDVVGEGNDGRGKGVVILQRDLGRVVALGAGHVDDLLVQGRLVAVVPADEFADAALVAHGVLALFFGLVGGFDALVFDGDVQARVQKRLLAHAGMQGLIVVFQRVEHLGVRLEGDLRAVLVRGADDAHFLGNMAAGELHLIDLPVLADLDLQPLGQRVDDRRAHAVQTARDLVSPAAEFAARVQNRIDDLQRGLAGLCLDIDGDAAAVVGDGDGIALVDGDHNVLAVSGQRLIDRVVDDLIHQMVQAGSACRADVHAGPLADGLESLQHLDLTGVVFLFGLDDILDFFAHSFSPFPGMGLRCGSCRRLCRMAALYFVR